jgi:hypothetical protein
MLTNSHQAAPDRPETSTQDPPWLNAKGAAARASVSVNTILREARAGRLRCALVGGRREKRFRPSWVDQWLESTSRPVEAA